MADSDDHKVVKYVKDDTMSEIGGSIIGAIGKTAWEIFTTILTSKDTRK